MSRYLCFLATTCLLQVTCASMSFACDEGDKGCYFGDVEDDLSFDGRGVTLLSTDSVEQILNEEILTSLSKRRVYLQDFCTPRLGFGRYVEYVRCSYSDITDSFLLAAASLPNLRGLRLEMGGDISSPALYLSLALLPKLERLDLRLRRVVHVDSIQNPEIEDLNLCGSRIAYGGSGEVFFHKVRRLCVSIFHEEDVEVVVRLVRELDDLEQFNLMILVDGDWEHSNLSVVSRTLATRSKLDRVRVSFVPMYTWELDELHEVFEPLSENLELFIVRDLFRD